jgi:hypothetical protein
MLWYYCGAFRLIYSYSGGGIYHDAYDDLLQIADEYLADLETDLRFTRAALVLSFQDVCAFMRANGYEFVQTLRELELSVTKLRQVPLLGMLWAMEGVHNAVHEVFDDQQVIVLENKMKQVGFGATTHQATQQQRIGCILRGMIVVLEFAQKGLYAQFAVALARMQYNNFGKNPVEFIPQFMTEARSG